jgi:alcohol dehydrogenase class IV
MTIERFAFPTAIHFGPEARKLVAEHLRAQGLERPLIVTDRGIAPLPLLARFVADLHGLDVAVYSGIWGNPVKSQVDNGVAAFHKHRADSIIGLGGGAALDVAKAIALMAVHQGDVLQNVAQVWVPWPCVSVLSGMSLKRAVFIRLSAWFGTSRLRGLMKSSAEFTHVSGTRIFSRLVHGL